MFRLACLGGRVGLPAFCLLLTSVLPGCSSDRMVRPQPDSTNVVQRPTYEVDGEKTFYLGGYAGADYQRPGR